MEWSKVDVTSPVHDEATQAPAVIGTMAQMSEDDALAAVEAAKAACGPKVKGRGHKCLLQSESQPLKG